MAIRLRKTPSGETFLSYEKFNYSTNAELVDINVNNILYIENQYTTIIDLISTLPDLSGVYTKSQTDDLLLNKLDKGFTNDELEQTGAIFYSQNASPTMSKVDANTLQGTQLRLLTTSIAINSFNGALLEQFIPTEPEDITNKLYVDTLNLSKAEQSDLLTLSNRVINNENNISDLGSDVTILSDSLAASEEDIEDLQGDVLDNTDDIAANAFSIASLNNLIQQSFNTFGSFTSPLGEATDEIIRPLLSQVIAMDEVYVDVSLSPDENLFINKKAGKIVFTISLSNLTNEATTDSILKLNIYYNEELILEPAVTIPLGWSGSRTITGALNVDEDSEVYFEYEVTGSLSVDAPIQYNVNYASESLVASPSSQIINDKLDNPNIGINADLNNISTNKGLIDDLQAQISSINIQIEQLKLPIGAIVIADSAPQYGTWTNLGGLAPGATIVGAFDGTYSSGQVIGHNHIWAPIGYKTEMSHKDVSCLKGVDTYNIDGDVVRLGDNDYVDGTYPGAFYTNKTGGDYNYPYGLGIGLRSVFRRET